MAVAVVDLPPMPSWLPKVAAAAVLQRAVQARLSVAVGQRGAVAVVEAPQSLVMAVLLCRWARSLSEWVQRGAQEAVVVHPSWRGAKSTFVVRAVSSHRRHCSPRWAATGHHHQRVPQGHQTGASLLRRRRHHRHHHCCCRRQILQRLSAPKERSKMKLC